MLTRPSQRLTGGLAGFGAGALFAALSIELVAPIMLGDGSSFQDKTTLLIACALGGFLFIALDQILNARGGYLRKTATTILYLNRRKSKRFGQLVKVLAKSEFFRTLPPDSLYPLFDRIHEVSLEDGETVFSEGDSGDRMFVLEEGTIRLIRDDEVLSELGKGEILGEIALLTGAPRTATAVAVGEVKLLELSKHDFDRICRQYPTIGSSMKIMAADRLDKISQFDASQAKESARWASIAGKALRHGHRVPTPVEVKKAAGEHGNAPVAIWLGALMDGVPENFVLGMTFLSMIAAGGVEAASNPLSAVPMTLLAGLFLSNFPEAMSSSVGMMHQGWSRLKILSLWGSLTVVTSLLTVGGYAFGSDVPHLVEIGAEGIAAGAMLTMIAQTMIPEAVHLGGAGIVGMSTLLGFLAAVGFKLFEG
jgi:hypothetical protein